LTATRGRVIFLFRLDYGYEVEAVKQLFQLEAGRLHGLDFNPPIVFFKLLFSIILGFKKAKDALHSNSAWMHVGRTTQEQLSKNLKRKS
jgi:hypothetical protein